MNDDKLNFILYSKNINIDEEKTSDSTAENKSGSTASENTADKAKADNKSTTSKQHADNSTSGTADSNESSKNKDNAASGETDIKITITEQLQKLQTLMHRAGNPHRGQSLVLSMLKDKVEIEQKELSDLLNMSKQSLAELLSKLEKSGFVEREASEKNKRAMVVKITEDGINAAEAASDSQNENMQMFDCLSADELLAFNDYLGRIIKQYEEKYPSGRIVFTHINFQHFGERVKAATSKIDGLEEKVKAATSYFGELADKIVKAVRKSDDKAEAADGQNEKADKVKANDNQDDKATERGKVTATGKDENAYNTSATASQDKKTDKSQAADGQDEKIDKTKTVDGKEEKTDDKTKTAQIFIKNKGREIELSHPEIKELLKKILKED